MSGLRERRHAETKQAILDAAFTLFDRHGFGGTAMDNIAERAGVSRSTLYRRYANKEDIVLEVPRRWLEAWDIAMGDLDSDSPLGEAVSVGCLAVASEIDSSSGRVLAAYAALNESPSLQSSGAATSEWIERFVALIVQRAPEVEHLEATVIAGAYVGAIDTMMSNWASAGGTGSVEVATTQLLDCLAPILRGR